MTLDLIGMSKEVGGSDRAESRIMTLDLDLDLDLVKIVALQRSRHQASSSDLVQVLKKKKNLEKTTWKNGVLK